jgi:hypothetical protein
MKSTIREFKQDDNKIKFKLKFNFPKKKEIITLIFSCLRDGNHFSFAVKPVGSVDPGKQEHVVAP